MALALGMLLPVQSSALAAPAAPSGPGAVVARWSAKGQDASAKIDKHVAEAFAASAKPQTFLVKLQSQADVLGAAATARAKAAPAQKEVSARSAVIKSLKTTAQSSQQGLLKDLEAAQKKGSVLKVESFWIANIVAVTSTKDVMEQIARRPDVAQIIPDSEIHLVNSAPSQGGPVTLGTMGAPGTAGTPGIQSVEWGIQRIGAPEVWSRYNIDGAGAVVASLDTGVDINHPALHDKFRGLVNGNVDPTYSWFDAVNGRTTPYDDHGHGTHTTGTMVGSDGANQIGVAPGAKWIAAKILSAQGSGSADNIIRAGQWVLAPGGDPSKAPDVVNNSWGGGPGVDDWFRDVVRAWRAAGIFPSFAAGNDGPADGSVSEPGNYPESFAVGAVDVNDNLADFSGRGPSPYNVDKPQVSAPGVNIRSSVPGGGYEGGWNGTSMATPHVSGTVALLRSANAALTVDQIEQILMSSADPKTNSRYPNTPNNGYGHGILNAFTAVAMVVDGVGTVSGRVVTGGDDFTAPTVTHTAVTEAFKHLPVDITANVSDDVSVLGVQLKFRAPGMSWWGSVDMTRTAGDYKSGTYAGSIPAELTAGSAVEYYITATDYGGNTGSSGSAAHPYSVHLLDGIQPGYQQDFEGAATGWTHGGANDTWQFGHPTAGPRAAHSGQNVASPSLTSNYPDGAGSYIISPPIDLTGQHSAAISFWHWFDFEPNYDYGYVLASGDGGNTWDLLKSFTGNSSGNWRQTVVDLTRYAGRTGVFVAFYLASDGSVNKAGWFIDDVALYVDTTPPAAPANLNATADAVGAIALTWGANAEPDLDHYTVYRSTTSGSGYTALGTTTRNAYSDTSAATGTTYYYVVTATDMFGNEGARSSEASATPTSGTTVFQDNMENGDNGWTHSGNNDSWQRGTPTSGPNGAHSGQNLWATNLAGNYADNTNASLVSPPISLTGLSTISLQFWHWYAVESGYDHGYVEVTSDAGAHWTQLHDYTGRPATWDAPTFDLSSFAGQTIQLRFRLQSDSSVNYAGWYIDDVRVAGTNASGHSVNLPLDSPVPAPQSSPKGKPAGMPQWQIKLPTRSTSTTAGAPVTQVVTKPSSIGIQSLPLDATVTVVETGRVIRTDPARGTFSVMLPAGTFTLRAEAYGYYPADKSVTVQPNADTSAIMVLNPIPHGQISGTVTDSRTGQPLAGAAVYVDEDQRIAPVSTGADGRFSLNVLAGTYTLEVRAGGYYPQSGTVTVAGGDNQVMEMPLEPFVGMPGEIAYDDGSADNAYGYYTAGNGWAVRMSPPDPNATVMVRGGRFYLWDSSWPTPGGNTFRAAIYAANPDGSPGRLLGGPIRVTNGVRGAWNDVDFSSLGIMVTGDFFVAYIQDADYPNVPGMSTDESSQQNDRNWQLASGNWAKWSGTGNVMIRALVNYEVGAPYIDSPADGSFTNQAAVPVSGTAAKGTTVNVLIDGNAAGTAATNDSGNWSTTVTLTEGSHDLTATATVAGSGPGTGTTLPSAPVTVTLDTHAPTVTITAPTEGALQNSRILRVTGQVTDANMGSLTVNGTAVTPGADGGFVTEMVGAEGANTITVVATDRAGNQTSVTRHVTVDSVPPALTNVQPGANLTVYIGDTVTVAFDSEPGLPLAAFQIGISGTAGSTGATGQIGTKSLQPGEIAMREVRAGHYEGTWTLPAGMAANAAYVRVRAMDAAGNETRVTAGGVLKLVNNYRPTAAISGPDTGRVNALLIYDGRGSTDRDGQVVAWNWDFGDGSTASGNRVNHRWTRPGSYTVTLTVTDNAGATATATLTVRITR